MFSRPRLTPLWLLSLIVVAGLPMTGCKKEASQQLNYVMGERITAGPMTYNVVQTVWRTQLGDLFTARIPEQRFLLISLSATNSGGKPVSVPFFTLEGPNRESYPESQNGSGVDNWFGLLRDLGPAQTKQGNIVFDVPLTSFRLRLTDGGEPGTEKYVWVEIPLRMDTDSTLTAPLPGPSAEAK
jgi:Domain of unknown function (DUF4352)